MCLNFENHNSLVFKVCFVFCNHPAKLFFFFSFFDWAYESIHPSNVIFPHVSYISGISEAMLMVYWCLIQLLLSSVSTTWSLWTPYTLVWTLLRVWICLQRLWKWNPWASCSVQFATIKAKSLHFLSHWAMLLKYTPMFFFLVIWSDHKGLILLIIGWVRETNLILTLGMFRSLCARSLSYFSWRKSGRMET